MDRVLGVSELGERVQRLTGSQKTLLWAPEKYEMIAGGFGSGKTRIASLKGVLLSALFPGNRGLVGRFHATDLEDSTIPSFMEVVPPSWIKNYRRQGPGKSTLTFKNGSQALFRNIHDSTAKSQTKSRRVGANLGWIFVDQAEEIELAHWNGLLGRLRLPAAKKKFAFGTMNPNGHDWLYKMFFMGMTDFTDEEIKSKNFFYKVKREGERLGIMVNSEENRISNSGFIDDDFFDQMVNEYSDEWRNRYVYCSFNDFRGKIYKDYSLYSVHNIDPFPIPQHWDLLTGIDVGGDSNWALEPNYIDEYGNLIVTEGFTQPSVNTSQIAAWLKSHTRWNSPNARHVIDWENKLAMLELAEFGIHAVPARKEVKPGLIRTAGYFHIQKGIPLPPWYHETQTKEQVDKFKNQGSPRIFVFKTNKKFREEHDTYVWDKDKTDQPYKSNTERWDTCDAERYVAMMRPPASKLRRNPDKYAELTKKDWLSAHEWQQFDKRIAARMDKKRGGLNSLKEMDGSEEVLAELPGVTHQKFDWEA